MSIDFDVNKVLDQLGQFVAAKGPVAYDAAVNVVKYNAVADLVGGGIIGGLFTLVGAGCLISVASAKKTKLNKINERVDAILDKVNALPSDYYYSQGRGARIYRDDLYKYLGMDTHETQMSDGMMTFIVGIIATLLGLFTLLFSVGNAWNWIAVTHPDVALAKQLFDHAMRMQ